MVERRQVFAAHFEKWDYLATSAGWVAAHVDEGIRVYEWGDGLADWV